MSANLELAVTFAAWMFGGFLLAMTVSTVVMAIEMFHDMKKYW